MPLSDLESAVDVAQAVGVLEFASDIRSVFEQVHAALKPGGVFVFTIESGETETSEHFPEAHLTVFRHEVGRIVALLNKVGFGVITDEAYTGYVRGEDSVAVSYHMFLAQKQ